MDSVTTEELTSEAARLFSKLGKLGWTRELCGVYAPLTLEITQLKKEKNAVILVHSYQTPDIVYGIADFLGDSYGLSKNAMETPATTIVFCGVRFMAETAKILNPGKTVIIPDMKAGCTLADNITAKDVLELRRQHPNAKVVCYVNTPAEVKAESDACCTSANAAKIVENIEGDEVIFIPDMLMARNVAKVSKKKIIPWTSTCIVHEEFTKDEASAWKERYPDLKILSHTECDPSVVGISDFAGSTEGMISYIKKSDAKRFMLVTECGLGDRMRVEFPDKEFIGMCNLCPYMKKINLKNTLQALKSPRKDQIVELDPAVIANAQKSLKRMFELTEK